MEALTQTVTELNGSVNHLIRELKKAEARIRQLEESTKPIEPPTETPLRGPATEQELNEVGRLPDPVRDLEIFEGDPVQYIYWVHSVEGILDDYKIVRSKPIYKAILKTIRAKIRGKANAALISHNIFDSDWPIIKNCLSLHYADKRDIRTLEHQLGQLTQGGSSLDEFYAKVNHQFSLIINKLKSGDYSPEVVDALIETYRNRALDVFIRGLKGDLSRMIIVQRPRTLPEAYTACLDIQNLNFRTLPIHGANTRNVVTVPINEMTRGYNQNHGFQRRNNTESNGRFNQGWGNQSGQSRNYKPYGFQNQGSNVSPPKGTNYPTPVVKMEVDRSAQTRRTNYPNQTGPSNPFKRGAQPTNEEYSKHQRLYTLESNDEGNPQEPTAHEENEYNEEQENFTRDYEEDADNEGQRNFMQDGPPAFFI